MKARIVVDDTDSDIEELPVVKEEPKVTTPKKRAFTQMTIAVPTKKRIALQPVEGKVRIAFFLACFFF